MCLVRWATAVMLSLQMHEGGTLEPSKGLQIVWLRVRSFSCRGSLILYMSGVAERRVNDINDGNYGLAGNES